MRREWKRSHWVCNKQFFPFANGSPVCDMGKICQAWQVLAVGCTLSLWHVCRRNMWIVDARLITFWPLCTFSTTSFGYKLQQRPLVQHRISFVVFDDFFICTPSNHEITSPQSKQAKMQAEYCECLIWGQPNPKSNIGLSMCLSVVFNFHTTDECLW